MFNFFYPFTYDFSAKSYCFTYFKMRNIFQISNDIIYRNFEIYRKLLWCKYFGFYFKKSYSFFYIFILLSFFKLNFKNLDFRFTRIVVQRAGFEPANPYRKGYLIEAKIRPKLILSPSPLTWLGYRCNQE